MKTPNLQHAPLLPEVGLAAHTCCSSGCQLCAVLSVSRRQWFHGICLRSPNVTRPIRFVSFLFRDIKRFKRNNFQLRNAHYFDNGEAYQYIL